MSTSPIGSNSGISGASFNPDDFEALVFAIQMQRVSSLDQELGVRE